MFYITLVILYFQYTYVLKSANTKWPRVHLVSILVWTELTEWLLYVKSARQWKEQEENEKQ